MVAKRSDPAHWSRRSLGLRSGGRMRLRGPPLSTVLLPLNRWNDLSMA